MVKFAALPTRRDPRQISVLNGMRVMSLGWVMMFHVYTIITTTFVENSIYAKLRTKNVILQTILNGHLAVDTFLVMGGLLVMSATLRALERDRSQVTSVKYWLMFLVHRVARLWPTLLLAILFVAGMYPNLAPLFYSPLFQNRLDTGNLMGSCSGSDWITSAFFLNNILDTGESCLSRCHSVNKLTKSLIYYIITQKFITSLE